MSTKTCFALVVATVFGSGCAVRAKGSASTGPAAGPPPPHVVDEAPPPPMEPAPPHHATWDKNGWVLLGETWVQGKTDHDVVPVGRQAGKFTKLMVVVDESDLEMHQMTITYGTGKTYELPIKQFFRENTRTRAIDLPGEARIINKLEFTYSNLPGGGRAKVEVWGKEGGPLTGGGGGGGGGGGAAPPPPPPAGPAWHFNSAGWTLLGEAVVNGKKDTDVIHVGKKAGKFTKLMVVVEDSELEMQDMDIQFAQGGKVSPEVKHFFRENDRTRAIDLPGETRFIKQLKFKYGNLPGGGKAKVQVWGKEG